MMGIAYRCDADIGLTIAVWDGTVTAQEWHAQSDRAHADPAWPAGRLFLTDVTTVSDVSHITDELIAEMAKRMRDEVSERVADARWALVAGDAFWMARKFARVVDGIVQSMVAFNSLDTACIWLGVDLGRARAALRELRTEIRARDQH